MSSIGDLILSLRPRDARRAIVSLGRLQAMLGPMPAAVGPDAFRLTEGSAGGDMGEWDRSSATYSICYQILRAEEFDC